MAGLKGNLDTMVATLPARAGKTLPGSLFVSAK